jgi:hypothetical protein
MGKIRKALELIDMIGDEGKTYSEVRTAGFPYEIADCIYNAAGLLCFIGDKIRLTKSLTDAEFATHIDGLETELARLHKQVTSLNRVREEMYSELEAERQMNLPLEQD